jgi:hypothetical protein
VIERDYIGEIDYFAVYRPETSGVYLVPIQYAQVRTKGSLRVHTPRNNHRRLIRLAHEYEIGRVDVQPLNA